MHRQTDRDPYRGRDPRQIPAYTLFDASRYLHIPKQTIRNWVYGYPYATRRSGKRKTTPLIDAESWAQHDFSFFNLVELHVLSALRREHQVQMPKIRRAIEYLKAELGEPRPLINQDMETEGTNIFVRKMGQLINVSEHGQFAMKEMLHAHLKRIDRDPQGVALRLYPLTRGVREANAEAVAQQPRLITIDPAFAFGRPAIRGTRVPTLEIYERFNAGESPEDLALDFGRELAEIHEAIRCENNATV